VARIARLKRMGDQQHAPGSKVWTESPWFYIALFSAAGLAAAVAIAPKYSRREAALEQKYEARQQAARRQEAPANQHKEQRLETGGSPPKRSLIVPLNLLMLVLSVVLVTSILALAWTNTTHSNSAVGKR